MSKRLFRSRNNQRGRRMMGSKVTVKGRRRRSLAVALVVAIVAGTGYAATTRCRQEPGRAGDADGQPLR